VPDAQTYKVNWTPQSVTLPFTTANGTTAFSFSSSDGNRNPTSGGSPIAAGAGTQTYSIRPASKIDAVTAYSSTTAFPEKQSTITYNLTIGGSVVQSKAITFKQIAYQLITSKLDSYVADGSTYSFYVKSNAAWKIKSVEGATGLLNLQGTDNLKADATGNDAGSGTKITFRTANATSDGTVTVKFASTDNPAKFAERTVTLNLKTGAVGSYYPPTHNGWAGSNIYWDGSKLTFADSGTIDKQNYQGVYFPWGSLYGLDPSYASNNSTSWTTANKIYKPKTDDSGYEVTSGEWNSWPGIGNATLTSERGRAYLYEITNGSTGLGDICKYLTMIGAAPGPQGKQWRMPTSYEFDNTDTHDLTGQQLRDNTAAGDPSGGSPTWEAPLAYWDVIAVPFAGGRYTAGELTGVNNVLYLWSSSASQTRAYGITFATIWQVAVEMNRGDAYPVRCVQE
jgi:hypothetical protein